MRITRLLCRPGGELIFHPRLQGILTSRFLINLRRADTQTIPTEQGQLSRSTMPEMRFRIVSSVDIDEMGGPLDCGLRDEDAEDRLSSEIPPSREV